jgi:hypothetical protein
VVLVIACEWCAAVFEPPARANSRSAYCSGKCRTAAWRDRSRADDRHTADRVADDRHRDDHRDAYGHADDRHIAVYVGGVCPDPLDCEHKRRYVIGHWSCAANHPRADGSAPDGRTR